MVFEHRRLFGRGLSVHNQLWGCSSYYSRHFLQVVVCQHLQAQGRGNAVINHKLYKLQSPHLSHTFARARTHAHSRTHSLHTKHTHTHELQNCEPAKVVVCPILVCSSRLHPFWAHIILAIGFTTHRLRSGFGSISLSHFGYFWSWPGKGSFSV